MLDNKDNSLNFDHKYIVHFQEGDHYTILHMNKKDSSNEQTGVFERGKKTELFQQLCDMVSTGEVVEMHEDLENRLYSFAITSEDGTNDNIQVHLHNSDYIHEGNGVGEAFHILYQQHQDRQLGEGKLFYSNLHGQLQVNLDTLKERIPVILCIGGLAAVLAINHMSDDSPVIGFVRDHFLKKDNQYSAEEKPATYLTDAVQKGEYATFTWPTDDGMEEVSVRKR